MLRQHRAEAILANQTAVARKVYDATPILESWSLGQINAELRRAGFTYGLHEIQGALHHLIDADLVKEQGPGYIRTKVKESAPVAEQNAEPATIPRAESKPLTLVTPAKVSSLDALASFSQRLRDQAASLNAKADELDSLALMIATENENQAARLAQFDSLRQLLAGLKDA